MRKVLITGGTRGLGKEMAVMFMKAGYFAIVTSRHAIEEDAFAEFKGQFKHYTVDVCDFDQVQQVVGTIIKENGPIDVLINNAGITNDSTFKKMTKEKWDSVISANLNGVFNVTKAVVPSMIENKYGRIISLSSVVGLAGNFGQTNYCATKAGVIGFTKSLALELVKYGITVNAIAPGFISTEMTAKMPEAVLEGMVSKIPAGKMGAPADIARAALFLADENNGYIVGETISVNGGLYMS